jgi:hypothetical protein
MKRAVESHTPRRTNSGFALAPRNAGRKKAAPPNWGVSLKTITERAGPGESYESTAIVVRHQGRRMLTFQFDTHDPRSCVLTARAFQALEVLSPKHLLNLYLSLKYLTSSSAFSLWWLNHNRARAGKPLLALEEKP